MAKTINPNFLRISSQVSSYLCQATPSNFGFLILSYGRTALTYFKVQSYLKLVSDVTNTETDSDLLVTQNTYDRIFLTHVKCLPAHNSISQNSNLNLVIYAAWQCYYNCFRNLFKSIIIKNFVFWPKILDIFGSFTQQLRQAITTPVLTVYFSVLRQGKATLPLERSAWKLIL